MSGSFVGEYRVPQVRLRQKTDKVELFAPISSSNGVENDNAYIYQYGPFEQLTNILSYTQINSDRINIEVSSGHCTAYSTKILKYLPEEFAIKDYDGDLSDYLQIVAISMDEFHCFIEDFTTIFDPDKCDPKYLPYLAKLINWPLNTRGFDSKLPSVRDAAISRGRKQLRQAVEVYKRKGLKEAFQILFYSLGYYVELVELWTNNYSNFVEQVPAGEPLYNVITNPNGWYKSPYFGVRLTSLNQSIEISTGGEGQPWNFGTDALSEILDSIHSIRPVNTVLYWINYYFDLVEKYTFTDLALDGGVSWEPTDEFFNCGPGDPIYLRDDRRLDGITRNGGDALAVDLIRDPQPGLCDPDLSLLKDLSDINWIPEPWCSPATRDANVWYRDGYNPNPRNGIMGSRDPSAFGGRNGFYYRDTPLAPYDPATTPNGLVWDRSGCYTVAASDMVPLYQIAEEAEDGIELYYNQHEFLIWLDTMTAGFGPDPSLLGNDNGGGTNTPLNHNIAPNSIDESSFGTSVFHGGNVNLLPSSIASQQSFGTANLPLKIQPTSIASVGSFGGVTLNQPNPKNLWVFWSSNNYAYKYSLAGSQIGNVFLNKAVSAWAETPSGSLLYGITTAGISIIDPSAITNTTVTTNNWSQGGPGIFRSAAYADSALWFTNVGNVLKVNPSDGTIITSIDCTQSGNTPQTVIYAGGYIWAGGTSKLLKINPTSGAILSSLTVSSQILAWDGATTLYGSSPEANSYLSKINMTNLTVTLDIQIVGLNTTQGIGYMNGYVYVTGHHGISKHQPSDLAQVAVTANSKWGTNVSIDTSSSTIWVADENMTSVSNYNVLYIRQYDANLTQLQSIADFTNPGGGYRAVTAIL